jgi:hypothetical protein
MMIANRVCPGTSDENFNEKLATNICQKVQSVISNFLSNRSDQGLDKYKQTNSQNCYPLQGEDKTLKLCIVVDEAGGI